MLKVNPNYEKLPGSYLFAEIARRVKEFSQANPNVELIRLGIGDVTRPLAPAVVEAFEKAVREMGEEMCIRDSPGTASSRPGCKQPRRRAAPDSLRR